ncbi:hypothetical protein K439DRAFT_1651457 [Ramaria rubella]|nr:hypothetical protein K439DRAFT_1651457 [Ramaria rubella]
MSASLIALDNALQNQRNNEYPQQIWFMLAGFIGLLTLSHIGTLIIYWRHKTKARSNGPVIDEKISLRRLPIAIWNTFRVIVYRISLPIGSGKTVNFAEVGIASGYIVALFTWEFINCTSVVTGQVLNSSYWSDRAANIVAINFPLLVALAGKNNLVSLLTGISYEKINILHRVAARVCFILIWVHAGGRIKIGLVGTETLAVPWVRTGIAIGTAYTLLLIISVRPLRTRFYEFFFFSHFMLVLMIVIGSYFHVRDAAGFSPYLFPTFGLWALDRVLRLLRVLWNNRSASVSNASSESLDASAELISSTMVRLTLNRRMTWRAGQNVFITMPGVSSLPFEAHPFTIASIPRESAVTGEKKSSLESNELVFYVKVRRGFTKRLQEVIKREGDQKGKVSLSTYIDGPYGSPLDVNAYDSVILIGGGSGISYIIPLLQDIVRKAGQGWSACRSVLFVWVTPHRENFLWISDIIRDALATAPQFLELRFELYATQDSATSRADSSTQNEMTDFKVPTYLTPEKAGYDLEHEDRVSIKTQRPVMHEVLHRELDGFQGSVSVNVAGPPGLGEDVRRALGFDVVGPQAVLKGGPDVTLHVETYGIA